MLRPSSPHATLMHTEGQAAPTMLSVQVEMKYAFCCYTSP